MGMLVLMLMDVQKPCFLSVIFLVEQSGIYSLNKFIYPNEWF